MELNIRSRITKEKLKIQNILNKDTSSKSLKMAPEENKNGSFEYFDEQELDDSESFFMTPD